MGRGRTEKAREKQEKGLLGRKGKGETRKRIAGQTTSLSGIYDVLS